jgi:hypothetical protein
MEMGGALWGGVFVRSFQLNKQAIAKPAKPDAIDCDSVASLTGLTTDQTRCDRIETEFHKPKFLSICHQPKP